MREKRYQSTWRQPKTGEVVAVIASRDVRVGDVLLAEHDGFSLGKEVVECEADDLYIRYTVVDGRDGPRQSYCIDLKKTPRAFFVLRIGTS